VILMPFRPGNLSSYLNPDAMHPFIKPISAFLVLLFALTASAQQKQGVGCIDPGLRQQAHEMKQGFEAQGFEVMRDAMIHMSDRVPFPVVIDLEKGVFYQIIFIGNTRAARLTLETYDSQNKRMDERVSATGKNQPNYISFSFTPEKTGPYVFSLLQKMKRKGFCGSFTVMALKEKK